MNILELIIRLQTYADIALSKVAGLIRDWIIVMSFWTLIWFIKWRREQIRYIIHFNTCTYILEVWLPKIKGQKLNRKIIFIGEFMDPCQSSFYPYVFNVTACSIYVDYYHFPINRLLCVYWFVLSAFLPVSLWIRYKGKRYASRTSYGL